ncbi:MAG: hypothetical protein JNM27_14185 [Leptospirales bacterium]|nr:hypothetical protein [Leptospirales bacterium]
MNWINKTLVITILTATATCGGGPVIENTDSQLGMAAGRLFYQGKPFTGQLRTTIVAVNEVELTSYKDGVEHGESTVHTLNGTLVAQREYRNGSKHGLHRVWFPNGNLRAYQRFNNGQNIGQAWLWFEDKKPAEFKMYGRSGEILAAKMWRRTGQIYLNYVFENGGSIGMPGSKVCDPVGETK